MVWPLGLLPIAACQEKEFACDSTMGLSPQQLAVRTQLAYVDRTPNPEADCANCQHYVAAPSAGECGTCKVMPGPTHPKGFCKVWVKTA